VVLAYLLSVTTLLLSIGRLADMIGKKNLYAAGLGVFTAGSVLCGLSFSIYSLIAFRILQAVGGAMIMALGPAIITETFPASERGKALGISGMMVSLGVIAGPTVGGLILQSLSWHWIFFVNLPVGILGVFLVLRYVPATRPSGGQRFDLPGAGALLVCLTTFLLGLTLGQRSGFQSLLVEGLLAAAVTFLAIFIVIERRSSHPMIDLSLFRNQLFSINLVTGLLAFISSAGVLMLMPFYLEDILGYSPREVGMMLAVLPIALGITAPIAGSLSDRFGTRPLAAIGLAVLVGGYLAVSTLSIDTTPLGYILRFLPIGVGAGLFQSPNNSAVMGAVPRNRLGIASGLLALTRTLGQITGIAILGALWSSRASLYAGSVVEGGVTNAPKAIQVAALNDTTLIIVGIISSAFLLSLWALIQERRSRLAAQEPAVSHPRGPGGIPGN
jgi:EmrB/QacA subfamily drug resistance transporter